MGGATSTDRWMHESTARGLPLRAPKGQARSMDLKAPGTSTTATDAAIRIRGLRKVYGGLAAVDGIDLDIARGETFALLGPNGAGKSTTVEILEGYRLRTAGEVS